MSLLQLDVTVRASPNRNWQRRELGFVDADVRFLASFDCTDLVGTVIEDIAQKAIHRYSKYAHLNRFGSGGRLRLYSHEGPELPTDDRIGAWLRGNQIHEVFAEFSIFDVHIGAFVEVASGECDDAGLYMRGRDGHSWMGIVVDEEILSSRSIETTTTCMPRCHSNYWVEFLMNDRKVRGRFTLGEGEELVVLMTQAEVEAFGSYPIPHQLLRRIDDFELLNELKAAVRFDQSLGFDVIFHRACLLDC